MLVADVSFYIALTDAIVEPLANSVWYFLLDKFWASKVKKKITKVFLLNFSFPIQPLKLPVSILHQLFLHFLTMHNLPFSK